MTELAKVLECEQQALSKAQPVPAVQASAASLAAKRADRTRGSTELESSQTLHVHAQVAGLAKELKRERQALSKAQQVPTTQSTADALPAVTDPLPAAKSAGVSSADTDAVAAVKDVSRIPVLQPPPVPAAPAVVQKAPAIVEKAPELGSAAGAQLAQLADTKWQAGDGQAAAENATDDAGYWLFSHSLPQAQ